MRTILDRVAFLIEGAIIFVVEMLIIAMVLGPTLSIPLIMEWYSEHGGPDHQHSMLFVFLLGQSVICAMCGIFMTEPRRILANTLLWLLMVPHQPHVHLEGGRGPSLTRPVFLMMPIWASPADHLYWKAAVQYWGGVYLGIFGLPIKIFGQKTKEGERALHQFIESEKKRAAAIRPIYSGLRPSL